MKMGHGLKMLALRLNLLLIAFIFCFSVNAKTLKVDEIAPSVTNGDMTISRDGTGDIVLGLNSGFVKLVSGVITEQTNIDLTSDITGVLPIANGGTNSSTALSNSFVMESVGGAIVESSTTSTELSYLDATSSIQTQIDATVKDTGDESIAGVKTFTGQVITSSTTAGSRPCPEMTEAQRDAIGSPANGDCIVNSDTNQLNYYLDSAWGQVGGGGSGGINFITNSDIESNADGYSTYADAAGENAVDGTGGSATTTCARNETAPLRDTGDLKIVKDAANRQGEGCSYDFTINNADKSQWVYIKFYYDTSHTGYADDDIRVNVYDVTNTNLIRLDGNSEDLKGGKGFFEGRFQAASDSTSYRMIVHISSTNATAYDIYFDNFEATPTGSGGGSSGEVVVRGAGNSGAAITADTERIDFTLVEDTTSSWTTTTNGTDTFTAPENGYYSVTGSLAFTGGVTTRAKAYKNGSVNIGLGRNSGDSSLNFSGGISLSKGDTLSIVVGTGVTLSNNTEQHWIHIQKVGISDEARSDLTGQDVRVEAEGIATTTIVADTTSFDWIETLDTTDSYVAGVFTAPRTDVYKVKYAVRWSGAFSSLHKRVIDGTWTKYVGYANSATDHYIEDLIHLNKGQTLQYRPLSGSTAVSDTTRTYLVITNKRGESGGSDNIATVAARYTSDNGQTVNTGGATFEFEDLVYDTHSAYNTTSGEYTVPVSGKYIISVVSRPTTSTDGTLSVMEDGTARASFRNRSGSASTYIVTVTLDLNKDQVVIIANTGSNNLTISGSDHQNVLSITRVK